MLRIPVFTTDSFPALQFNPSQKPFVAFRIVPITVIKVRVKRPFIFAHRMEELTFPKGPSTGIDIRVAIFLASTWFELDSGDASFVGLVFKLDVEYSGGRTLSAPIKI